MLNLVNLIVRTKVDCKINLEVLKVITLNYLQRKQVLNKRI